MYWDCIFRLQQSTRSASSTIESQNDSVPFAMTFPIGSSLVVRPKTIRAWIWWQFDTKSCIFWLHIEFPIRLSRRVPLLLCQAAISLVSSIPGLCQAHFVSSWSGPKWALSLPPLSGIIWTRRNNIKLLIRALNTFNVIQQLSQFIFQLLHITTSYRRINRFVYCQSCFGLSSVNDCQNLVSMIANGLIYLAKCVSNNAS